MTGGTGTGKTTILNALSSFIPEDERIVTIEDAVELQPASPTSSAGSRPPNVEGRGEVTIRDLVRNSLRMRPDRIIVGEVRGPETLDMLQAMNTGHDGSLSTGHANSPRDVLSRMETMVLMAGIELPSRAIREQIASALHLIVHLQRFRDGSRRVTHVTEVGGMEGDIITLSDVYAFDYGAGVDADGRSRGTVAPRHQAVVLRASDRPRAEPAGGDVRRDRPVRREPAVSAVRKLVAAGVSVVTAVLAVSGPAGAAADDEIEIIAVDAAAYPTVSAVVATPPGPAGATYSADTFEVLEAGRRSRRRWSASPPTTSR